MNNSPLDLKDVPYTFCTLKVPKFENQNDPKLLHSRTVAAVEQAVLRDIALGIRSPKATSQKAYRCAE
jgi:hypothetical protein